MPQTHNVPSSHATGSQPDHREHHEVPEKSDGWKEITWHFAKPPRPEQVQIFDWLNRPEGRDELLQVISAPTGVGKSPVNAGVAISQSGGVLVPTKALQDQYLAGWPGTPLLKGASNYPCRRVRPPDGMKMGTCKQGASVIIGRSPQGEPVSCRASGSCPFTAAKMAYMFSQFGITNYACYLAMKHHDPNFKPGHKWLLCDEGHNLDEALINVAAFDLTDQHCRLLKLPPLEVPTSLDEALGIAERWADVAARVLEAKTLNPIQKIEVSEVHDSIRFALINATQQPWCYSYIHNPNGFTLKPVFSKHLYKRFLGDTRVLITSATPPPQAMLEEWAGKENVPMLEVDSPFPVANRPIYYRPAGYLNRDNMADGLPKVINMVRRIIKNHPNDKGIIHCHNFRIVKAIQESIGSNRLLIQDRGNRERIVQAHLTSKAPTILVSPSMSEGVDLYDDLGRFNIVCKVPYPSLGDSWVKARTNADQEWYSWTTAKDIVQMVGRTTRHDRDWSTSYIVDGVFGRFYDNNRHLFPAWFRNAIQ